MTKTKDAWHSDLGRKNTDMTANEENGRAEVGYWRSRDRVQIMDRWPARIHGD